MEHPKRKESLEMIGKWREGGFRMNDINLERLADNIMEIQKSEEERIKKVLMKKSTE